MKLLKLYILMLLSVIAFVGCGGGGSSSTTVITSSDPIANAGADKTILINDVVTITGTGSDADGNVSFEWRDSNNTLITTNASFDYNGTALGVFTFKFLVKDDDNITVEDSMNVNVLNAITHVSLSGKITYDLVPVNVNANSIGLDYTGTTQEPCKLLLVELLDSSDNVMDFTETNSTGDYSFTNIVQDTEVKVRVYAKMHRSGATPAWDVKVVDNTNTYSTYVMEGSLTSVGDTNTTRDLNAVSGWGGSAYTSTRVAAPFAMLDTVYSAMSIVLSADSSAVFAPLVVNWSTLNTVASGNKTSGQIGTSHYIGGNLFILGDDDLDTDEYDDHVIAHEWGHYYEDKFSRSDSIGGSHGGVDILDIRVAFGEGWGNAFSGMALNNPIYFDTSDAGQTGGFTINVESGTTSNPGWFSETSVENILYDLFDSTDDNNDTLSLGFGPIHNVFIGAEKATTAFTSIFTFIKALKDENGGSSAAIDNIVSDESITTISDIYGTGRTNKPASYPYHDLDAVTKSVVVTISNADGSENKLSNRQYVKFDVSAGGDYTIKVTQTNGTDSDPDFYLYKSSPFAFVTLSKGSGTSEQKTVTLTQGSYLLDISDYKNVPTADLNVTVN